MKILVILIILFVNILTAVNPVYEYNEIQEYPFKQEISFDYIYPFADTNMRRVTSPFGYRIDPISKKKHFHKGIDIACPIGTPIIAIADGHAYTLSDKYGCIVVWIYHDTLKTCYAHLNESLIKERRQEVKQGDTIGYSGMTGYATGPHLHFHIKNINTYEYIEPTQFFQNVTLN